MKNPFHFLMNLQGIIEAPPDLNSSQVYMVLKSELENSGLKDVNKDYCKITFRGNIYSFKLWGAKLIRKGFIENKNESNMYNYGITLNPILLLSTISLFSVVIVTGVLLNSLLLPVVIVPLELTLHILRRIYARSLVRDALIRAIKENSP